MRFFNASRLGGVTFKKVLIEAAVVKNELASSDIRELLLCRLLQIGRRAD
jgi:hypothetical protein